MCQVRSGENLSSMIALLHLLRLLLLSAAATSQLALGAA